jgi:hypothetical protein
VVVLFDVVDIEIADKGFDDLTAMVWVPGLNLRV